MCVCVCVFSLKTLLQYEGNIIFILLTNSYFLIVRLIFLFFSTCIVLTALTERFQGLHDIVWVRCTPTNQPTNQPASHLHSTVPNQHCIITTFTRACHLFLSGARSIHSTPHSISGRSNLILSSDLHLGIPSGSFHFLCPQQKPVCICFLPQHVPRSLPISVPPPSDQIRNRY